MSFQQAVKEYYSKYADFSGRATRSAYWWAYLWQLILTVILVALMSISETLGVVLYIAFAITHIVPLLAVTVRRLHDGGTSAWGLLITFIPIVGGIAFLYMMIRESEIGQNSWGPMIGDLN